jgi:hypothetical protein
MDKYAAVASGERLHQGEVLTGLVRVRQSRLLTPYAEHLLHRFCNYQCRIPLPENHEVQL